MLLIPAVIAAIVLCGLWILLPQRKLPKEERIPVKKLILSFVMGAVFCTLCIIIADEIFDKIYGQNPEEITSFGGVVVTAFLRAALIEEAVKFIFVKKALKKIAPKDNVQFMIVAGTMGMAYNIMEKVATLDAFNEIMNAVFPFHIFLQFLMAIFLFKAAQCGKEEKKKKFRFNAAALFIPVVVHGAWDFIYLMSEAADKGSFDISADWSTDIFSQSTIGVVFDFILVGIAIAVIVVVAVLLKKMKVVRLPGVSYETEAASDTDDAGLLQDSAEAGTDSAEETDSTENN